ncbi:MAG: hypothetical protein N3A72_06175 [bacterium]|nr:hypothetical protein [bacterium]
MKLGRNPFIITALICLLIIAIGVHALHLHVRKNRGQNPFQELLYLPSGKYLKVVVLGFDNVIADILWLRAIQYFGGHFMGDKNYAMLDRIFEVTTTLEPTFIDVYRFATMALGEEARRYTETTTLLWKGIERNPTSWEIPYDLGFFLLYTVKDYDQALLAYSIATSRPNCPDFVHRIIPFIYSETGREQIAIERWREIYRTAKDDMTKEIADRNIKLIYLKKALKPMREALLAYKKKHGRFPPNIETLVQEGYLRKIPPEPYGSGWAYDPQTGWLRSKFRPEY